MRLLPTHLNSVLVIRDCIRRNWRVVAGSHKQVNTSMVWKRRSSSSSSNSAACTIDDRYHTPNLLTDETGLSHLRVRIPFAQEKFTQEWIERFFLAAQLFTAAAVLLAECAQEPFQHSQSSLFGVCLLGWGNKDSWMFCPIGRVLRQGSGGQDEWWSSQRRKVSVEGRDGLDAMKSHEDQPPIISNLIQNIKKKGRYGDG